MDADYYRLEFGDGENDLLEGLPSRNPFVPPGVVAEREQDDGRLVLIALERHTETIA